MVMKRILLAVSILLLVIASGCLFRPPAEVTFSLDRTTVTPGGTLHVIVTVNNTGKVGLTGATLIISNGNFEIIQEPKFPDVLPVGKVIQLVWIVRAPVKPGLYNMKLSLELTDELKRTWTGFYDQFRVVVSKKTPPTGEVTVGITAPGRMNGGAISPVKVEITNTMNTKVILENLKLDLLPGMNITSAGTLPDEIGPGDTVSVRYVVRTPYAYRNGYISAILKYNVGGVDRSAAASFPVVIVWEPWNANTSTLRKAYGFEYHWITDKYLVDGYWAKKYNSTPDFNRELLRKKTLALIRGATSETQAAGLIYDWITREYTFGGNTTTLKPSEIMTKKRISYAEGQILLTAMLRSINIPARVVTLYNGTDCTMRPMTEFYTSDGWYIIDLRHSFIGDIDDYLASPYFPRLYQLITEKGYRLVAQSPTTLKGHAHIDVTGDFMANLEDRLIRIVSSRLKPQLRSKFMIVLNDMNPNERLYALFLFSSAPNNDALNAAFEDFSTEKIEQNVKALYEFYKDMEWSENFTRYWKIFVG
ncbi:transglutaminase domain-containing protein [Thermococcus sp.]|uniref:transglutaminase domain-containing protein n=1 Tax=Thermococcus sp. TaxID=35749 RepID=UPI002623AD74|nr:transglutaminase domain-containing protein [Thermococcus sp.]